jgi:hypothetical protein
MKFMFAVAWLLTVFLGSYLQKIDFSIARVVLLSGAFVLGNVLLVADD